MGFTCYARWARCRAAHVSPWARQVNLHLDGRRTASAAASAVLHLCAESRPAATFPEQQTARAGRALSLCTSDVAADDTDALAALIEGIASVGLVEEILADLHSQSIRWTVGPTCGCIFSTMINELNR